MSPGHTLVDVVLPYGLTGVRSDLDQTVAVTGSTAYAIADAPHPFAAHLSHAEVADMFRKCNAAADFNSAKVIGWVPSNRHYHACIV
jgi:hypothetical protein